ncbi:anti-sigma factor family protein [Streptomyces sp. NPDC008313]|uniref:anti-sigma factor family protein n=1 Tax=Streptomyces sp. NPDC008313 TaxID=3364826 RepID=UPI0036E22D44
MTTTDTAGHPDVEEISDLTEGLLPASRTAELRHHLEGCSLCADVHDSLTEIRGLLGTLPGSERMPADVAGRIDAALAAEVLLTSTAPDSQPATEKTGPAPSTGADVSRETSASAPVGRPAGYSRAATGPGRTKKGRHGRRNITIGAVLAAAAVGLGSLMLQAVDDDSGKPSATATQPHMDAAHTYADDRLQGQVADLLASQRENDGRTKSGKPSLGIESDSGATGMERNNTFEGTTVRVPSCIEQAIPGNQALLASDEGVYDGRRVYLVVTPDASGSGRVTAYVVDAACTKRDPASKGEVLLKRSYARS